ncbi:MAG TPA: hypothetical protein ENL04_03695 [Sulfuricurvum sp.]|nr:hypothetical protein [Sulfuricurvum sp.]
MKSLSKAAIIALLGLLSLEPALLAETPHTVKRERVNLKLQNIKIEDFIKMAGKVIGENILLTQPIPGTVNFVSSAPIYKDELMDILLAVLGKKGFTIVEDGSFLKVERANTAVKRNLPIGHSKHSLMKTEFIEVQNENVDILAAKVRQFLSEGGKLLTIKESNTMIVSDYPKNIGVIKTIVNKVERQRSASNDVKFVQLKHAKASRLAAQVTKIAQSIINQKVESNKVQILSDDATNSIIILASSANIEKLVPVVTRMDAKDDSANDKLTIIPLENSEAKNVVTSLQQVLDKKQYAKPTDKPIVSVYEELNAIVVSGRESDINDIKEMVGILDVEKPQVFVKARIIEINQNMADSIGVKYGLAGGAVTDAGLFTFAANLGGSAVAFDGGGLLNLSSSTFSSGIAFGATVDFLASNGAANTLSQPTLLCVNNQESSIYVGKTEPIITSTQQGTQSTSLARNTYTRQDIGLTLKVKPRLSQGDKVTLISTAKLEDILNSSVPGLPSTTKREVVTTAIVNNGESVIIGGLIYDKNRDERQGIPGLRDIPYLGYLFDWKHTVHEEINLVIILTPFIVRHNEDMPRVRKVLQQLDEVQEKYKSLIERKLEEHKEELEKKGELTPEPKPDGVDDPMNMISPSKR